MTSAISSRQLAVNVHISASNMFRAFCIVLIGLVVFQIILQVCLAEGKKRRRRCPNVCVRRFTEIQKKVRVGPQGPPGPRGPRGPSGPKGTPLVLPACKFGEYLTSDGVNLRCEKLDVCNEVKQCQKDGDPDGGQIIGDGKMIKFMKKDMIQSLKMDAWDVGTFRIDGTLYFGLSQLGTGSFIVHKWEDATDEKSAGFVRYQDIKMSDARNWETFVIDDDTYFAIANTVIKRCPVYKWNKESQRFNISQNLPCEQAFDVQPFKLKGIQHLAITNYEKGQPVRIFRWNGAGFEVIQEIDITAMYVETFLINQETYLGISGPFIAMYKWNGKKFVLTQRIFLNARPYEMAQLSVGNQLFVSIATLGTNTPRDVTKLVVLRWNGREFESFQNITAVGARRVAAISSPLMGKENTYLAVINYFDYPAIYVWDRRSNSFQILHKIKADRARNMCFFEMDKNVYLLLSAHRSIEVFKGSAV